MKTILLTILLITLSIPSFAAQWCHWDGNTATNCQSDGKGYIKIDGFPTRTVALANASGWYKLVSTQPTVGPNQKRGDVSWIFEGNKIYRTWAIEDLTEDELLERDAGPMSVNDYYQWKGIQMAGGWTDAQMIAALPPSIVEAYIARKALEDQ